MESTSHSQRRQAKLASIRGTLAINPILVANKAKLKQKMVKNKIRRDSIQYGDNQLCVSKNYDDIQVGDKGWFESPFKDKYLMGQKKGEGCHGVVRICYQKQSGKSFAVKTQKLDREHILYLKQNFMDIKSLTFPHIPSYYQLYFELKSSVCHLVMEYVPFPNLLQISISSQQQLKQIVHQILKTLKYIHEFKICHRDIKPQNILYDQATKRIIVIDFGVSKKVQDRGRRRDMLTMTGTPDYRAPEMFEGGGYDEMVDMWALGVSIYQLMTGITPFYSMYPSGIVANISKADVQFPQQMKVEYSLAPKNLVRRLLKKDKNERLTAEQALKDVWFYDLNPHYDQFTRSLELNRGAFQFHGMDELLKYNTSLGSKQSPHAATGIQPIQSSAIRSIKQLFPFHQSSIYGIEQSDQKQIP